MTDLNTALELDGDGIADLKLIRDLLRKAQRSMAGPPVERLIQSVNRAIARLESLNDFGGDL